MFKISCDTVVKLLQHDGRCCDLVVNLLRFCCFGRCCSSSFARRGSFDPLKGVSRQFQPFWDRQMFLKHEEELPYTIRTYRCV